MFNMVEEISEGTASDSDDDAPEVSLPEGRAEHTGFRYELLASDPSDNPDEVSRLRYEQESPIDADCEEAGLQDGTDESAAGSLVPAPLDAPPAVDEYGSCVSSTLVDDARHFEMSEERVRQVQHAMASFTLQAPASLGNSTSATVGFSDAQLQRALANARASLQRQQPAPSQRQCCEPNYTDWRRFEH